MYQHIVCLSSSFALNLHHFRMMDWDANASSDFYGRFFIRNQEVVNLKLSTHSYELRLPGDDSSLFLEHNRTS